MSVDIVFICDRCGCSEHVDGEEPSRVLAMYTPPGWGSSNSGFKTPYRWLCEFCNRLGKSLAADQESLP